MKFLCERDALKEGMAAIIGRTKHGKNIPILGHVLIEAQGRAIRLTGNDLDSCGVVEVPAEVSRAGAYTINADRLNKLIGGLPSGGQITLELEDGATVAKVKAGRSVYSFSGLPATDFPDAFTPRDPVEFALTPEQVKRLFKVPAPSILRDGAATRPYLAGIFLHHETGRILACATNGHTLIRTSVAHDASPFIGVIVPESACDEIVRLGSDSDITVRVATSLIEIERGKRRFVSKLIDGTFPDYQMVIPQSNPPAFVIDVKDMDAAVARLMAIGDGGGVKIAWNAQAETLSLHRHGEHGEGNEIIACDCPGRQHPGEVVFQPEYLRFLIEAAGGETATLHIDGPGDPARITNRNDPDFVSVIMPRR